jgi:hypothetical protein
MTTIRQPRSAVSDALDLIGMPLALEVLGDLAAGRAPDARGEDHHTMATALTRLAAIGAVTGAQRYPSEGWHTAEITPQGEKLYWRLVDIEHMAEQLMDARQTG